MQLYVKNKLEVQKHFLDVGIGRPKKNERFKTFFWTSKKELDVQTFFWTSKTIFWTSKILGARPKNLLDVQKRIGHPNNVLGVHKKMLDVQNCFGRSKTFFGCRLYWRMW